jgi:hypothetical protein
MKKLFYFMLTILLMAGFSGCMEEIKKTPVSGDEIYADNTELELLIGQKYLLKASPNNGAFTWTSSDPSVATVVNGLVEAVGPGDAEITVGSGDAKIIVYVVVGSRMPKLATHFGNGLLVRWDSVNSDLLKFNELTYLDQQGRQKTVAIDGRLDSAFVADFSNGLPPSNDLQVASVYYKNDTIRVKSNRFQHKRAATVVEFSGVQIDARNFDYGKNVGWHDNTPQNTLKNKYREDLGENNCGVDIASDNSVGDLEAGEWLQYTIQVNAVGTYYIEVNGLIPGDTLVTTTLKFVLDNGTDTIFYKIAGANETTFKWLPAKAKDQPFFPMEVGRHTLKLLFTDNNIRLANLRLRPKTSIGGSLVPALQYLFEFPDDYTKPSIGNKNLAFTEHNNHPLPLGDLAAKGVVPLLAKDAPVDGVAITIPKPVTMRVTNPSYNESTNTFDTIKKYTMMWDVKVPSIGQYYALLHTQESCTNGDGHFFIDNNGRLGRGDKGPTVLVPERWYRVVLTVDVSGAANPATGLFDSAKYIIYLDGQQELDNTWIKTDAGRPARMMLHRQFWVASDEDGEDNQMDLAQFCFWADTCLNASQIVALGKIRYPVVPPLGITSAVRFPNGVLAFYEDAWRVNYYAQYVGRTGTNYGYYTSKSTASQFYPYCYTGLRVSEITSSGRLGTPIFFPESKLLNDLSTEISDTAETVIPMVNFDGGGEGIGYHDIDGKSGGNNYRINVLKDIDNRVDVEGSESGDPFNDMNIGYTAANEWLQYTVYVPVEGKYAFDVYVTVNGSPAAYSLSVNGTEMKTIQLPNQNNWNAYRWYHEATGTVCDRVITLRRGYNVLRYNIIGGSHNLKGIRLKPFKTSMVPPPSGMTKATRFGNGLAVIFDDVDCVGTYTLSYVNNSNVTKKVNITKRMTFLAGYKSGLTVTHLATDQVIPFNEAQIVDKTRTLTTDGTLEIAAVDFDGGGSGVGYNENTSGNNAYRDGLGDANCGVGVSGSGAPADMTVTNMKTGEWLQYTLNVETEGDYAVDLNIAVYSDGSTYSLTVNGKKTAKYPLLFQNGATNTAFLWHSNFVPCLPIVHLKQGSNTLRFNVESMEQYILKGIRLGSPVHTPVGIAHATQFANGLTVKFSDNGCVNYTLGYTNTAGAATTKNITATTGQTLFIADYKSDLTVKVTSSGTDMAYDVSQIVNKTRTLASGATLDIAAADFDGGGNNVGYKSANIGANAYRAELDDLNCPISVAGSGAAADRYINNMKNGDWLQYTIDAESEGDYSVDLNIAVNGANARYTLEINGTKTAIYNLVNNTNWTPFWHSTKSSCLPIVHLKRGINALRFHVESYQLYDLKGLRLAPAQATHEPGGISRAVKFGNILSVRFMDNLCVNYTLEYINSSGVASTKNVTAADVTQTVFVDDYQSGLTAKVTATGAVVPFTNIEDVSGTVTAANGLEEMWAVHVDYGGRNVGYYDQSNGGGNTYRNYLGDVDNYLSIEQSGTNPATLNLSHTGGDEWYQYTIFVETAGAYKFDYRVSTNGGACAYKLTVNGGTAAGGEETGVIELQNWSQWQSYRWYHEYYNATQPNPVVNLRAGRNTIRLSIPPGSGGYNIRSWRLLPQ